jgi:integrase
MAGRKTRRARGEGAVYQRKSDGLWVGMLDLGIVGGKRRRKSVYGQTEGEARGKLRRLQDAQASGLALLAPSHSVGQWLDIWLSDVKAHDGTRPATLALYRGLADHYIKPVIGGIRLDRLTPAHIQRLISETRTRPTSRGTPPSAATQRHVHKLIRNALGDAYRMELVTRNVAVQVKAPPVSHQRRPDLSVEDARRVLTMIEGERLEAFYVLALTTGLRRGELLGLRWDDIDMSSRQLQVRRALQRAGGTLQFVEPKTASSLRVLVIPKLATLHLERHRARQDEERRLLGAAWQDYGLVFASSVGTPLEPRNVNRRWDELRERAGLHWLRLHDLRHGCATLMLAAGVPARTIMDVLGHSEIGVTMNTYTHVLMQLREDAADAIDGVLGG